MRRADEGDSEGFAVMVDVVVDGSAEGGVGVVAVGVVGGEGSDAVDLDIGAAGVVGDADRNAGSEYGVAISTGGSRVIHSRMWASAIDLSMRSCEFQTTWRGR